MRSQRSSLFNIYGDDRVSLVKVMAYLCANAVNNARPFVPGRAGSDWSVVYSQQQKILKEFGHYWANVEQALSPTRALSNLFWMALPWQNIRHALGRKIHVLDVGCGAGGYFERLQLWTKGMINSYHGIDIEERPEWKGIGEANSNVSFRAIKLPFSADDIPPKTNLLITQSAIEHFEFDALFFSEVKDFVDCARKPLLQVHLVPSAACLWLYLTHGYRQYTPYTIGKMTECFSDDDTRKTLFPLGGRRCNRLHFSAITLSRLTRGYRADRRKANPELYQSQLRTAILKDIQQPGRSPSFYAIILASHLGSSIFDLQEGCIP